MENLLFSLNATVPVFFMMVLGMILKKIGWISESFASQLNRFVFLIPLPVLLFQDIATVDFVEVWDFSFVVFCFVVTLLSITIATLISCFFKEKSIKGEFIQATYRSSAALLGVALIQNIYGQSSMGPLMIIGSVPLYNIFAVIILSFYQPQSQKIDKDLIKKTCKGVLTNPIIIGIVAGLIWSLCHLPMPAILSKSVSYVANTATPLGLMAMGASFEFKKAVDQMKPAVGASFFKLFGFCALFLPLAIVCGFHNEQLIAILVMLGSATTVTCYVMAKNMGHVGVLSSNVVMMTTLLSGFSLTFWIWVLKTLSFI
ncbi:AEC family transporter [Allocoprobacillus halotolerans]|uniref:AEC family transporter n=1 Tax=Allocoprobacillus halotolerans TaxID=2944914 RepID=A0ABY5HXK8_9FIRM|nr:AEC family transporter [Allocoprobacillus halotolerans]UTY37796.1 AEC family transporter [Allocoprobacillus halotolerans]